MNSRREMLAGLGTVAATSLAGCSTLPWTSDDAEREITVAPDAVPRLDRPTSPFPVDVPTTFFDRHKRRGRELLADVPSEPEIPNETVASELAAQRQAVEADLASEPDDEWPLDRLASRRYDRGDAAEIRATYRAATGDGDSDDVIGRRRRIRTALGSLVVDDRYRGTDPIEAVVAHASIEALVATARRLRRADPGYPDDPVAEPFRAGEAVRSVERAVATISDASRLHEHYVESADGTESQGQCLLRAADRLDHAVREARGTVEGFLDVEESPFDRDLERTAARRLFEEASARGRYMIEEFRTHHEDGEIARTLVRGGQALAAIEALRAIIRGIRDEGYATETTVDTVRETARRTRENLAAVTDSRNRGLAVTVAEPGIRHYEGVVHDTRDEYTHQGDSVHGDLAWCELYTRAVPAATAFVVDEIEAARAL